MPPQIILNTQKVPVYPPAAQAGRFGGSVMVEAAVGNVFGEHLSGFDPELLRLSFDAGIRTSGARDHSFAVLVGAGTEPFADGAELDDFRFLFGATQGF